MSKRTAMLATSIRKIIAPVLRECPRACGVVSITNVELSSDLSFATVSVSALREPEEAMAFLEVRRRALQKNLGALQTHKTPQLRFRLDCTAEEASRIEKLLDA